jgi:hypothetical protein
MEKQDCRESLARRACSAYLKTSPGTLVRALAVRCGRGILQLAGESCLFRAQARRRDWLVHCDPGRHPAKRRATRATTLGLARAGLFGDVPPKKTRARIMRPPG